MSATAVTDKPRRFGLRRSEKPKLPPPLVNPARHPIRWTVNKVWMLAMALVLAHVGIFAVAGLYYVCFETIPAVTQAWHDFSKAISPAGVDPSYLRHMIRNVGEYLLGGFLAQQALWNPYKRSNRKYMTMRCPPWRIAASPVIAIIYGVPGFVLGFLVVKWLHGTVQDINSFTAMSSNAATGSIAERSANAISSGDIDQKVIGFGASLFLGRRAMRPVFDEVQQFFVQRRVALDKALRPWHAPTFRARYNATKEAGGLTVREVGHQAAVNRVMLGGLFALAALAATGWYVITYVAH